MRFHTHAQVPWNALSFLFFNSFKMLYESMRNAAPAARDTMVLSAMGGLLAGIIMTPVDVVKTRLMLQVSAPAHILRLICLQSVNVGAGARTSASQTPGSGDPRLPSCTPRVARWLGP